jgi:hypothetical protein
VNQETVVQSFASSTADVKEKINLGMRVRIRDPSTGRISSHNPQEFVVIEKLDANMWRVEETQSKTCREVTTDCIAICRKRRMEQVSVETEQGANDEEERFVKVGVTDQACWYAKGVDCIRCVPLNERVIPPAVFKDQHVDCSRIPHAKTAGVLLQEAITIVESIRVTGNQFKIGITGNPFRRWDYYMQEGKWIRLVLIGMCNQSKGMEYMEAALIKEYQNDPQCLNKAPGGEGQMCGGPPYYTYCVISDGN